MKYVLIDNRCILWLTLDVIETECGLVSICLDFPMTYFANAPYRNTRPR
jgi:hypothetical protein